VDRKCHCNDHQTSQLLSPFLSGKIRSGCNRLSRMMSEACVAIRVFVGKKKKKKKTSQGTRDILRDDILQNRNSLVARFQPRKTHGYVRRTSRTVANANVARCRTILKPQSRPRARERSMIAITDVTGQLVGRDSSNRSIPPVITSAPGCRARDRTRGLQITRPMVR